MGRPRVVRLASSRAWISRTGPPAARRVTLRFVLSRPAIVEFVVLRVAPDCRQVGRFRVVGHAGVNRVQFRGRLRGRWLPQGAYRIRARTLPRGRALAEARLVIFRRTPHPAEVAAGRASNTCRTETESLTGSAARTGAGAGPVPGQLLIRLAPRDAIQVQGADRPRGRGLPAGVLGVQFSRAAEAAKEIHPLFYVLLGIAIALLGLAALPVRFVPNARIAALLAYRRSTVAIAGTAALVTVSVLYAMA